MVPVGIVSAGDGRPQVGRPGWAGVITPTRAPDQAYRPLCGHACSRALLDRLLAKSAGEAVSVTERQL